MKLKWIDKHYLYLRDHQKCYFCGKSMPYNKVSIDHYLPKSMGGTDEVFNLVTSCKSCNGSKKNIIPGDVEKKHLEWFIQGVLARKILKVSLLRIDSQRLDEMVKKLIKSYASGSYTLFETSKERIYVKENKIYKITEISQENFEDESD